MSDGRTKYVQEQCETSYSREGKPLRSIGIVQDITERKQAQEELRRHREHLEDLVKTRTAEIEKKNAELERMNRIFVGRELRMKELKKRIAKLEESAKRTPGP